MASAATTVPKILFIGNSLTYFNNGLWSHVKALCDAAQPPVEIVTDKAVEPGATLAALWSRPQPRKRLANHVSAVILQDDLPETTVADFHQSVRLWLQEASAKSVRPLLLMTWSYSRLSRMPQHIINDAHKAAAAEHSVTIIPAGAAFEKFESQPGGSALGIRLRADDGEHPRLPGMSDEEAATLQTCAHEAKL